MNVVVSITDAELRGTPFSEYESVLHNLIGEGYADKVDGIEIVPAHSASVVIDGSSDSPDAREILDMAGEITHPDVKHGYFG
jgi:hypothetical protein